MLFSDYRKISLSRRPDEIKDRESFKDKNLLERIENIIEEAEKEVEKVLTKNELATIFNKTRIAVLKEIDGIDAHDHCRAQLFESYFMKDASDWLRDNLRARSMKLQLVKD